MENNPAKMPSSVRRVMGFRERVGQTSKRGGGRTDLAPIPSLSYENDMKEKIRIKWTE